MAAPRPTRGPSTRRRGLRFPGGASTALFTAGLLLLLAAVEWAARFTRSDVEDAFPLLCVVLLVSLVRRRHAREPLPWVTALGRVRTDLLAAFRRRTLLVGIDLRREPPVPEAFPPVFTAAVAALAGGAVALLLIPSLDALALRDALRTVSATLAAALVGAGWLAFAMGGFFLLFLTFALTHDALVRAHDGPGPRPRKRESWALCGWVVAILLGWALLPPWIPVLLTVGGVAAALLLLTLPGSPDASLLWKPRADGAPVRSTSWARHTLMATACLGLLIAEAVLFAKGSLLRGGDDARVLAVLPLTVSSASLFAWTGAATLLSWCHALLVPAFRARFADPAKPPPVRVLLVEGEEGDAAALAAGGVLVRTDAAPLRPCEVPVAVREGPPDPFAPPVPGGPVVLAREELPSGEGLRRVLRRRDVLARRRLLRGLEGLFRRAAGRKFARGAGFWVAPWHWFCIGLSRDEDERTMDWKEGTFFLETIGPAYHRVFPREALHHAFVVMRDLHLDLLFVEDGVGFRRLRRVLRRAFELHDRMGDGGRAEDHHFTGLPGVRVMIHHFDMDEPWKAKRKGWPEPDYESVGRARILHVFKDRGESEETVDAPRDRRGAPVLV